MRLVSQEHFLQNPVGHFVLGDGWAHFYASEALCGPVMWDRPSPAEMEGFVAGARVGLGRAPHAVIADVRDAP
jgi:hypothetical protein